MPILDGTQEEIGRGAQAAVYSCHGYAYKVYNKEYPAEWIRGELQIQDEINKTSLPVVSYYETKEPNIIQMDLISGITLGDRILKEKYEHGVDDLIGLQKRIHTFKSLNLPSLNACSANDLTKLPVDQSAKDRALKILDRIPDKQHLLHLDFHFLNVMYTGSQYYIIDWVNARIGNPIYDYARNYVIMNEFADQIGRTYLSRITEDPAIDTENLTEAIYVMALLRLMDVPSNKTLELIRDVERRIS